MGLHAIDFLSDQPRNFIFQKTSNKTNLGGILSLIYLIIFLIITVSYFVFYALKDNYSIEYLQNERALTEKEFEKYYYDPKYNPKFLFDYILFIEKEEGTYNAGDRFKLFNLYYNDDGDIPLYNYTGTFNKNIWAVNFYILYDCLYSHRNVCEIDEKYIPPKNEIKMKFQYHGFKLDHQNKSSPLYINDERFDSSELSFKYDYPSQHLYKWNIIKYAEEKGFFSIFDGFKEKNEDYGKEIGITCKNIETHNLNEELGFHDNFIIQYDKTYPNGEHYYKLLGQIRFVIDYNHYEEYKRTAKSFWDTVANICSLSLSVFNGFSFVFAKIYSNNFDNYKILEKILFNIKSKDDSKIKKTKTKEIELNDNFNKKEVLIDKKSEDQNIIIKNVKINEFDDTNNENNNESNDTKVTLPKLRFFDFIFNNIYNSKHCKMVRQEIIDKCNEIILKYYSEENILYNQLMLEILLKDYKWNDPELNKLDNNKLILQLKNQVNSFNYT